MTGTVSNSVSPIQPVTKGKSDSQKSRCMLAHKIFPLTRSTTTIMWWWLFQ